METHSVLGKLLWLIDENSFDNLRCVMVDESFYSRVEIPKYLNQFQESDFHIKGDPLLSTL